MKGLRWYPAVLAGVTSAAILAACAEPAGAPLRATNYKAFAGAGATLVECPASESFEASRVVTGLGGSVSVGGTTITLPVGAVRGPTKVTLRVPASNYMEIDVGANDQEHFTFAAPVSITISYARCTRTNIDKAPLTVWYVDPVTRALIAPMGGVDDKAARTITFTTDHLSGYIIAN